MCDLFKPEKKKKNIFVNQDFYIYIYNPRSI